MAVAGSSWGNLGILRGVRVKPLVASPPQSSGEFLLDQILYEVAHPPAQDRLERVEPALRAEQRRVG